MAGVDGRKRRSQLQTTTEPRQTKTERDGCLYVTKKLSKQKQLFLYPEEGEWVNKKRGGKEMDIL